MLYLIAPFDMRVYIVGMRVSIDGRSSFFIIENTDSIALWMAVCLTDICTLWVYEKQIFDIYIETKR